MCRCCRTWMPYSTKFPCFFSGIIIPFVQIGCFLFCYSYSNKNAPFYWGSHMKTLGGIGETFRWIYFKAGFWLLEISTSILLWGVVFQMVDGIPQYIAVSAKQEYFEAFWINPFSTSEFVNAKLAYRGIEWAFLYSGWTVTNRIRTSCHNADVWKQVLLYHWWSAPRRNTKNKNLNIYSLSTTFGKARDFH